MAIFSRRRFIGSGAAAISAASVVAADETSSARETTAGAQESDPLLADEFHSKYGRHFASDAVHVGENQQEAVTPIHFGNTTDGQYAREGTPTTWAFEEKIAALEGAEAAMSASCGMATISQTLMTLLSHGDRIVRHRCVYVGTRELIGDELQRYGIQESVVDMRDILALKVALRSKPKIVYFEPHSNPTVEVLDVRRVIRLAKEQGAITIVDNTYLSPYLLQPLRLGADLVLHSATKYIGGHGDCMAGVVAGRTTVIDKLKESRDRFGGILSPHNASLLLRGLKTLPIRMESHCTNAMRLAEYLATHRKVALLRYPGHPSHPEHAIAREQVKGFGGMLGFIPRGGDTAAAAFGQKLRLCKNWTSLGDVKTLVRKPYSENEAAGILAGYIRVSVGVERIDDIIADFRQAFEQI